MCIVTFGGELKVHSQHNPYRPNDATFPSFIKELKGIHYDFKKFHIIGHRCDTSLKGLSRYVGHLKGFHPDDNSIFCPFCEKFSFQAKKELRRHVVMEHKVSTTVT